MSRYAGLFALFACACAISEPPQPDRQTHWMEACESDVECGDLECACGVCTLPCEVEDEVCEMGEPLTGSCIASAVSPAAALCGRSAPTPALCLPSCADDAACAAFAAGLECVDAVCVPEIEPAPAVAAAAPLQVSCEALYSAQPMPGVEVLASGVIRAFAASESGVFWATEDAIMGRTADAAESTLVASAVDPYHLAVEGEQVVWLENRFDEVRLHSVSLADGGRVELGRHASFGLFGFALELTTDSAFWGATGAVLRSSRTPGSSEVWLNDPDMLSLPHALMLDDSHGYYLRASNEAGGEQSIVQFPLDGDGPRARTVASGPIYVTAVDDGYLYYATTGLESAFDPTHERRTIYRMSVDGDGAPETVLVTPGEPSGLTLAGDHLYYWLAFITSVDFVIGLRIELWRAPRDGDGEHEHLVRGDGFNVSGVLPGLVVVDRHAHWLARCVDADVQSDFLVRVALP